MNRGSKRACLFVERSLSRSSRLTTQISGETSFLYFPWHELGEEKGKVDGLEGKEERLTEYVFHFLLAKQERIGHWQLPVSFPPYYDHTSSPFWYTSSPLDPPHPSHFSVRTMTVKAFPLPPCRGLVETTLSPHAAAVLTAAAVIEGAPAAVWSAPATFSAAACCCCYYRCCRFCCCCLVTPFSRTSY